MMPKQVSRSLAVPYGTGIVFSYNRYTYLAKFRAPTRPRLCVYHLYRQQRVFRVIYRGLWKFERYPTLEQFKGTINSKFQILLHNGERAYAIIYQRKYFINRKDSRSKICNYPIEVVIFSSNCSTEFELYRQICLLKII